MPTEGHQETAAASDSWLPVHMLPCSIAPVLLSISKVLSLASLSLGAMQ